MLPLAEQLPQRVVVSRTLMRPTVRSICEGDPAGAAADFLARALPQEVAHPPRDMRLLAADADLARLDPDRPAPPFARDMADAVRHTQHRHPLAIRKSDPRRQRRQAAFYPITI